MILAAFILGFSSILTGLNFIVTTHKLRAPGMGWFDMPLLIWALYATSIIQVLATPGHRHHAAAAHLRAVFHIGIFDPGWAATRCSTSTSSGSTRTPWST
jgi:cytochrome c oxidase subunit 1